MLREALDFPTSGDRGSAALLVGSVLLLFSAGFLAVGTLLPLLLVVALAFQVALRGYYVRVLRVTAADRAPVAPSFGDVSSLLRDGLVAVGVAAAYFLPALLLFAVAAGGNLASAVQNPLQLRDPTTIAAVETVGGLAALLGLFAALSAFYLVPGAVTLYAHEGRVRSAFDLRTVLRGTVSEDYAVGWVITLVLQALLFPIVVLLYSLVVGVFIHFFLAVSVRYVWGTSFGNALDISPQTVDREGITPDNGVDRSPNGLEPIPGGGHDGSPEVESPDALPPRTGSSGDASPASTEGPSTQPDGRSDRVTSAAAAAGDDAPASEPIVGDRTVGETSADDPQQSPGGATENHSDQGTVDRAPEEAADATTGDVRDGEAADEREDPTSGGSTSGSTSGAARDPMADESER